MSLQTITPQVLKNVVMLIGSDANLLRIVRGVIARDFPGFFPMEFIDMASAREALCDIDCDAVIAYVDPKSLIESPFWQILSGTTPFILFTDAIDAARPVVAREARVKAILDRSRPRTDVLATQIKQVLSQRAQALCGDFRRTHTQLSTPAFLAGMEHLLLLDPQSFSLRRELHDVAMQHLQADPSSLRLAQALVENVKRMDQLTGVEPQLLWDAAQVCSSVAQFDVAQSFLETLTQKGGDWKLRALEALAKLALSQNNLVTRRKHVLALVEYHEQRNDYRGMAAALEDYLLTQKPNLELAFKLLKALHHLGEGEKEAALLTTLLRQTQANQQWSDVFVRLQLIYGSVQAAAAFLNGHKPATAGQDQLWMNLADAMLRRGDGAAAELFSELVSCEGLTLHQSFMVALAYRFQTGEFAASAKQLYGRIKSFNHNVDLY